MFNDITYDKLTAITEKEKPYRGRAQEEYPYDVRSHGSKYFTQAHSEEVGGVMVIS